MVDTETTLTPQQAQTLFQSESLLDKARTLMEKRQYQHAEVILRAALDKRMTALGTEDLGVANIIFEVGLLYESTAREEEAINLYAQAIAILEKVFYAAHGSLAPILEHQANCYLSQEKFAEAEPILKRALDIYEKTLSGEHRLVLDNARNLSLLYYKLGKLAEAETTLTKALKQLDTPLGPAEEFRYDLALVYVAQAKHQEAEASFKQAIAGFQSRKNYPRLAKCLDSYVEFLKAQNRKTDAEKVEVLAKRMRLVAKTMSQHNIFPATLLRA
jgi:tetratricopeptide (TPR) repeat protein